jgi:hypothetical protein
MNRWFVVWMGLSFLGTGLAHAGETAGDRPALEDLMAPRPAQAASAANPLEPVSTREALYTVSSDELDPADSLNRISGTIDLGFSAPSQSFESSDHYKPGPFSREKAIESS